MQVIPERATVPWDETESYVELISWEMDESRALEYCVVQPPDPSSKYLVCKATRPKIDDYRNRMENDTDHAEKYGLVPLRKVLLILYYLDARRRKKGRSPDLPLFEEELLFVSHCGLDTLMVHNVDRLPDSNLFIDPPAKEEIEIRV